MPSTTTWITVASNGAFLLPAAVLYWRSPWPPPESAILVVVALVSGAYHACDSHLTGCIGGGDFAVSRFLDLQWSFFALAAALSPALPPTARFLFLLAAAVASMAAAAWNPSSSLSALAYLSPLYVVGALAALYHVGWRRLRWPWLVSAAVVASVAVGLASTSGADDPLSTRYIGMHSAWHALLAGAIACLYLAYPPPSYAPLK